MRAVGNSATEHGVFDEVVAATYDRSCRDRFDPDVLEAEVDFLADLAGNGRALEFAIGTGRVALPLRQRGIDVHGIEMSQPMLDQMLGKPGGDQIPYTVGDMATCRVDGTFQLVYLVFNTITNLLSQEEQVECFQNAAAHLSPGGSFVIDVLLPNLQRLPAGERFVPFDVSPRHLGIDEYDVPNQRLTSHHYWVSDEGARTHSSPHRYAWPAEYDLMAKLAGLALTQRWSNWRRDPFASDSTAHISVWEKTQR